MRKQRGYRILHDVCKAGALEKTGIVKTCAMPQPDLRVQRVVMADEITGYDEEGYSVVDGMRVLDAQPSDEYGLSHIVTLAQPQPPKFVDIPVPNEFFSVSPDAIDLDEAVYVGDRSPKTMSDLIALGYTEEDLGGLWGMAPATQTIEQARDSERSLTRTSGDQRTGAAKTVWLDEEYPLYDLNGDGIAERLFVHRVGRTVLRVEEIDEQPYSGWSPFPMQHRLVGQSLADKTMDIQRVRSVLLRQALDSQYIANAPRTLVNEDSITVDTFDDLLSVRPGGLIRYKGQPPMPLEQRDTSQQAFSAMEMMSAERESRTGVTRQSQGMNPDSMNKTAAGLAMNMASSQQIELYVTRNFVEMLVAPMFAKRYRLMRKYGQPFRMKIQGKYQMVDPTKWPEDIDMAINVGLGTGNKDQKLQYRMSLLGVQQQIIAGGLPIVGPEEIYQNVKGLVEDSGLGVASDFIKDPAMLGPQPEKQDPEALKVQGEQMLAQQREQNAHEQAVAKLQMTQQAAEVEATIRQQAAEGDLATKRDAAEQAAMLARDRAVAEAELAERRQAFEMDLARQRFEFDQELSRRQNAQDDDGIPSNRPGGDLAE
jgi:hypothetical protein